MANAPIRKASIRAISPESNEVFEGGGPVTAEFRLSTPLAANANARIRTEGWGADAADIDQVEVKVHYRVNGQDLSALLTPGVNGEVQLLAGTFKLEVTVTLNELDDSAEQPETFAVIVEQGTDAETQAVLDNSYYVHTAYTILQGAGPADPVAPGGTDHDDVGVSLGDDDDFFAAGNGFDAVDGGGGDDTIDGGDGDDSLTGGDGEDDLSGGSGDDTLEGNDNDDTLDGGDGSDFIDGGKDDDVVYGGGGQDTVMGGEGEDNIAGDDGDDELDGGEGDDTIDGGYGQDTLIGGDGKDSLTGAQGDDTLLGGEGNDTLRGGDGQDVLEGGVGNDVIDGGAGDDRVVYTSVGDMMGDTVSGGLGHDRVVLNLGTGTHNVPSMVISGIESIIMGDNMAGNIVMNVTVNVPVVGNLLGNLITGAVGHDRLDGLAGNDTLIGGDGRDTLNGGEGEDLIVGGKGNDTINLGTGSFKDVVDFAGNDGLDRIVDFQAGNGKDVLKIFASNSSPTLSTVTDVSAMLSSFSASPTSVYALTADSGLPTTASALQRLLVGSVVDTSSASQIVVLIDAGNEVRVFNVANASDASGNLVVTQIATLVGLTDIDSTTFHMTNFA